MSDAHKKSLVQNVSQKRVSASFDADRRPLLGRRKRANCRVCMLMITHACNLRCSYCYERHKDNGMMSFATAKSIIVREIEYVKKSPYFNRLEIDFMGGEPFMNFTLIMQVVEWIETVDAGFPICAFCSTNGTLATSEKCEWLGRHRRTIACGLSYDGTNSMQGANRSNSKIDLDFFLTTWPEQWIRITVSKETLPYLNDGVVFLQEKKAHVQVALAQGVCWDLSDMKIFGRELAGLSQRYLANVTYEPVEFLTRSLANIGKRGINPIRSCGAGNGMVTYDIDGKCYPCHMFTPIVLGERALEIGNATFCDDRKSIDPNCNGCIYLNWCSNCYGFNYLNRRDPFARNFSICEMTNVHARACCEFQLNYYYKNRDRLTEMDGAQIGAALDAYKIMSQHIYDWKECCRTMVDRKEVK